MADKDKKLRVVLKLPSKSGKAGASDSPKLESHKLPVTAGAQIVSNGRVSTPPKKRKFKTLVESDAKDDSVPTPVFKAPLPPPSKKPFQKKKEKPLNGVVEAPLASPVPEMSIERGHGAATAPAKKVLEGVLDKLKKKDTYGVFSEPVDANLVPDYYDVIKEPMDFGTMYKKIAKGVYCSLISFEKDIMLICNNAMRYNGPETIYYKQARSIQDAARKALDALAGQSGALEVGNAKPALLKNPVKKGGKNTAGVKTSLEPASSDFASGASLAAERDDLPKPNKPDAFSIRREPPPSDRSGGAAGDEAGNGLQSNLEPDAEAQDDHGAQFKPAALKDGRKPLSTDEYHRTSYKLRNLPAHGRGPLGVGGELHHLVPTGYQSEMAYAKSLSRFSARLGAEGWRFAAHRLQRVLAPSVAFGQGWIGEHEAPPGTIFKKFPPDVKPAARMNQNLVPTTVPTSLPPITSASLGPILPLPLMMTPLAQTAMDSLLTTVTSAMLASQASAMEISTENPEHSRGQGTPSTSDVSTGRPLWSTVPTSGMVMQAASDVSGWHGSTSQGAPTFVYSTAVRTVPATTTSVSMMMGQDNEGEEVHMDLGLLQADAMARANISPAPRPSQYMLPKPMYTTTVPSFGSSLVRPPISSTSIATAAPQPSQNGLQQAQTSRPPPPQLATATTPQPLQNGVHQVQDSRPQLATATTPQPLQNGLQQVQDSRPQLAPPQLATATAPQPLQNGLQQVQDSRPQLAPPQLATATTPQPLQNGLQQVQDSRPPPPDLLQPVDSSNQLKTLG